MKCLAKVWRLSSLCRWIIASNYIDQDGRCHITSACFQELYRSVTSKFLTQCWQNDNLVHVNNVNAIQDTTKKLRNYFQILWYHKGGSLNILHNINMDDKQNRLRYFVNRGLLSKSKYKFDSTKEMIFLAQIPFKTNPLIYNHTIRYAFGSCTSLPTCYWRQPVLWICPIKHLNFIDLWHLSMYDWPMTLVRA